MNIYMYKHMKKTYVYIYMTYYMKLSFLAFFPSFRHLWSTFEWQRATWQNAIQQQLFFILRFWGFLFPWRIQVSQLPGSLPSCTLQWCYSNGETSAHPTSSSSIKTKKTANATTCKFVSALWPVLCFLSWVMQKLN